MLSSMRNYDIASLSVVDELAENPILPEWQPFHFQKSECHNFHHSISQQFHAARLRICWCYPCFLRYLYLGIVKSHGKLWQRTVISHGVFNFYHFGFSRMSLRRLSFALLPVLLTSQSGNLRAMRKTKRRRRIRIIVANRTVFRALVPIIKDDWSELFDRQSAGPFWEMARCEWNR
jgi:hypothetical protein